MDLSTCKSDVELCSVNVNYDPDSVDNGQPRGEEQVDTGFQDLSSGGTPPNIYVGKRNFIHQLMDVALLMANVSQLKALLVANSNEYFYVLMTFICVSICLQVLFTICMLAIWSLEKDLEAATRPTNQNAGPTNLNAGNVHAGVINSGFIGMDNGNSRLSVVDASGNNSGGTVTVISTQGHDVTLAAELRPEQERKRVWAERLDRLGNILVLFIIVSNVFITGFGVEGTPVDNGNRNNDDGTSGPG